MPRPATAGRVLSTSAPPIHRFAATAPAGLVLPHRGGMTTATPAGRSPVDLRSPAQLLAALPYLIGFRPEKSVLLLGHRAPAGNRLGLALRGDLPRREDRARQARALAPKLAAEPHTGVTLVIIGGRRRSG